MEVPQSIQMCDRSFPLIIRRRNGHNLRLRVNLENQVVVSVPWHCSDQKALSFVAEKIGWLEKKLSVTPKISGIGEWLNEQPYLSADGQRFCVRLQSAVGSRASYTFDQEKAEIILRLPEGDPLPEGTLLKLVRRFAGDALNYRLNDHARRLGLTVRRATVRNQASRWGSCTVKGSISLNWRLVLLEPELQDYVILHELAHLEEMNHSARFWALLDTYDPERRAHEAELNAIAGTIMRVGRCAW